MIVQYQILINRSGEIKQYIHIYPQVYTLYANTAGTRIVCPIDTVNLGSARPDLVA